MRARTGRVPGAFPGAAPEATARATTAARVGGTAALLLVAGAGAAMVALAAGARRWRREVAGAVERLGSARVALQSPGTLPATPIDLSALDAALPGPVARYLAFALSAQQRRIRGAWMRWSGELRQAAGEPWRPFVAEQHVQVEPPGFAWDARVPAAPLIDVRVLDSYAGGEGVSVARLAGLVGGGRRGSMQVAQASLMRWLAEAPWYPSALLPSERLRWEARGDDGAVATLVDRGLSVSVEFRFGSDGRILACHGLRWRDTGGATPVLTPWGGRYRDWQRVDGMMIPMSAEVWWAPPAEGETVAWRGRIDRIAHAFA